MHERLSICSVNVGKAERVAKGGKAPLTGICKRPVAGRVPVGELGLDGDEILDATHHGGIDQAVYAYSADDYAWWAKSTGGVYSPGLFGENLTIEGLPSNLAVGDRLLIGDLVLEATSARIPCKTLAARMDDRGFGLLFRKAERPGVYFRVLNPGEVRGGDAVTLVEAGDSAVTVLDLFRFAYETSHDAERLRRFLDAPLAVRVRFQVESALAGL